MNYDNSLVVTIIVTCNLWAPSTEASTSERWKFRALTNRKATSTIYDNSLVVTITVTCYSWAPSSGDAIFWPPHTATPHLQPRQHNLQMWSDITLYWAWHCTDGCYGGGLVLCSARHVRCNSASFTHLQLMWTALHLWNLCKNSFFDCGGVKSQNNEIWKCWSWSGHLNKTVVLIRFVQNVLNPDGLESWNPDPVGYTSAR